MTAHLKLQAHLDRRLRIDAGMPVAYYEILAMLSESPSRSLRMSRLAEVCNSSRSRLSHAVAALEKEGWVSRCATAGDRRGSVAQLTDAGFAALESAAPGHVAEVRACLFDGLTSEQLETLKEVSRILHGTLDRRAAEDGARPSVSREPAGCEPARREPVTHELGGAGSRRS
ncbi:MarR family transcriptional regulator [Streptomyces sp. N2-109]|uniref:MarR family transcriptional regulator n=1 Tax=Streptomyces gossypii TaxID=2883101 RepID=A0ABT2JQM7_9ACTN|nr:MarR family transcriptional regulator [Streptomyces gossypii]MCT2590165.1 MarR family transcriptional regulator [Streptomyces gossypii]